MSRFCVVLSPPHNNTMNVIPRRTKMNPITRASMDSQFADTFSDRFNLTGVTKRQPIDSGCNFGSSAVITKFRHPVREKADVLRTSVTKECILWTTSCLHLNYQPRLVRATGRQPAPAISRPNKQACLQEARDLIPDAGETSARGRCRPPATIFPVDESSGANRNILASRCRAHSFVAPTFGCIARDGITSNVTEKHLGDVKINTIRNSRQLLSVNRGA